MTQIILLIVMGIAIGLAGRYAYLLANLRFELETTRLQLEAQHRLVLSLKGIIKKEKELRHVLVEIEKATSADDFNELYHRVVGLSKKG